MKNIKTLVVTPEHLAVGVKILVKPKLKVLKFFDFDNSKKKKIVIEHLKKDKISEALLIYDNKEHIIAIEVSKIQFVYLTRDYANLDNVVYEFAKTLEEVANDWRFQIVEPLLTRKVIIEKKKELLKVPVRYVTFKKKQ